MNLRTYRATGVCITTLRKLLGIDVRVTGLDALPEQPVLFVVNHFTRFETLMVPYVIYHRYRMPVHTLAKHTLFEGRLGDYLTSVGVISTRDPRRNRRITGDLMTGRANWVIYPEGGLIKNKMMVSNGKLRLHRDDRQGPPHTGAAVLALRAELAKRRYREAVEAGDAVKRRYYEEQYDLQDPLQLVDASTLMVPVNITYPRLRAGKNMLHRAARLVQRSLDPRLDEELLVEGSILFSEAAISIHFGDPIAVADYLGTTTALARRVVSWFRDSRRVDVLLRRQARRLTNHSMRSIYNATEVNLDHLFCYGLRASKRDEVPLAEFRRALFLAAMELRQADGVRLHPLLRDGMTALALDEVCPALDDVTTLAVREGVIARENGSIVINREALHAQHDFHNVRLEKMVQVIANELEPVERAVKAVRSCVNLGASELHERVARIIGANDRRMFIRDYNAWHEPGVSKPASFGEPFLLEGGRTTGIVLVHGYLACPEQMRPLAEALHAAGHTVYVVRLDGHGTSPRQLTEVSLSGWLRTLDQAYALIRHRCAHCIVGGFSLGGLLVCLLAAERGEEPTGVFTINAPLKLRHPLAPFITTALHLDTLLGKIRRSTDVKCLENLSESPDINYEHDYLHGLRELRRTIAAARRSLGAVTAPTLVLQTRNDPVVLPTSAEMIARRLTRAAWQVQWMDGDRHVVVRDEGLEEVESHVRAFIGELVAPCDAGGPPGRWRRRLRPALRRERTP